MSERLVSAGVFVNENDLSYLPQGISAIGAAIIGPTPMGPAFIPTLIETQNDYVTIFGEPDGKTYVPYTVFLLQVADYLQHILCAVHAIFRSEYTRIAKRAFSWTAARSDKRCGRKALVVHYSRLVKFGKIGQDLPCRERQCVKIAYELTLFRYIQTIGTAVYYAFNFRQIPA